MRRLPSSSVLALLPLLVALPLGGAVGCSSFESELEAYNACAAGVPTYSSAVGTTSSALTASLKELPESEVAQVIRDGIRGGMRATLEQNRRNAVVRARCGAKPVRETDGDRESFSAMPNAASDSASAGATGSSGGERAQQSTGTNNQVAGVDEADFVKNDGKYIYVAREGKLHVLDAFPAASMRELSAIAVPGEAKKLFVDGDRAIVFSSVPRQAAGAGAGSSGGASAGRNVGPYGDSGECTYGYDCQFNGDGKDTTISFVDLRDRNAPRIVRTMRVDSSLLAARKIGGVVHTVLVRRALQSSYPTSATLDQDARESEAAVNAAYDALVAQNEAAIAARDIDVLAPKTSDDGGGAARHAYYRAEIPDGEAFTTLLSFDVADAAQVKTTTIMSRPGAVYASTDAIYMAVPHERSSYGWYEGQDAAKEITTVHKLALGTTALDPRYAASGLVKGRVLNQFAMDEREGHLRIATTTGHLPSPDVHSTIGIFRQDGPRLVLEGKIDDIAKSEDIRSVRFDGERGYIVTFKKTDPLFVFDLSVPTAPRTLGELKIPGFSTYMHMMDATHLLTIGYDADDKGDFAFFTGVLLQIFDVSNPAAPRLAHKEVIGTRGSSSEALGNHLAFTYYPQKNLLALPMTICEGGNGNGMYGTRMTFSGLMVYDVTAAGGFALRGKVAHPSTVYAGDSPYDSSSCSNWWTRASSDVKRSLFMDDFVYSVSMSRVKANDVRALGTDLADVTF